MAEAVGAGGRPSWRLCGDQCAAHKISRRILLSTAFGGDFETGEQFFAGQYQCHCLCDVDAGGVSRRTCSISALVRRPTMTISKVHTISSSLKRVLQM
jgi:hypothetical protein